MKYGIPFIVFFLTACSNNSNYESISTGNNFLLRHLFANQERYSIRVGDTLKIYHSTNSCCPYCLPATEKLKHLVYVGKKIVLPEKDKCVGCNHTAASIFVAVSVGIDTLQSGLIKPYDICSDTIKSLSKYVVQVN